MNTPICDFVKRYAESDPLRLHMPGHKGCGPLGIEAGDITEVDGADSLYEADSIIRESERNAGSLFGGHTFYSAEGSSLCIRAMLYLAYQHAVACGKKPLIAAGRNAHKTFLSAAALLDLDILWLCPTRGASYLSCPIEAAELDRTLTEAADKPTAVYLTSPDYLGHTADLAAIAAVCRRHGVLLLVDNAHGAYLKFLPRSRHPMDLGADMCCDSAHKTLPVLTGGAYLHISPAAPAQLTNQAKNALALFGSTSPSYLILQSLDATNRYLADGYPQRLAAFCSTVEGCKQQLTAHGFTLVGEEPLKLTIAPKAYGYTGTAVAAFLRERGMECEFADPDYVVMMLTPEIGTEGMARLAERLLSLPRRTAIPEAPPAFNLPQRVLSVREATLAPCETLPAASCAGRILAHASVGCPPAVPIVVSGERIDSTAVACFAYYGIERCTVVKE